MEIIYRFFIFEIYLRKQSFIITSVLNAFFNKITSFLRHLVILCAFCVCMTRGFMSSMGTYVCVHLHITQAHRAGAQGRYE